ncbi:hypothetical protein OAX78_04430 [Planctomycetota bacterium]|nr:hypothetical protein [Planctomycetota bacterium]
MGLRDKALSNGHSSGQTRAVRLGGAEFGRIRGFRFYGREGTKPLVFKDYVIPVELAKTVWMTAIRNAVRRSVEAGHPATAVVRHGTATSEAHFQGELSRTIDEISEVEFHEAELHLKRSDGTEASVYLEEDGEADHVLIELTWERLLPRKESDRR